MFNHLFIIIKFFSSYSNYPNKTLSFYRLFPFFKYNLRIMSRNQEVSRNSLVYPFSGYLIYHEYGR